MRPQTPVALTVCRAVTVDHAPGLVLGSHYRVGGWPDEHTPGGFHEHSDTVPIALEVVFAVDEDIARDYPHRMRDGTVVNDKLAYFAYLARYT